MQISINSLKENNYSVPKNQYYIDFNHSAFLLLLEDILSC